MTAFNAYVIRGNSFIILSNTIMNHFTSIKKFRTLFQKYNINHIIHNSLNEAFSYFQKLEETKSKALILLIISDTVKDFTKESYEILVEKYETFLYERVLIIQDHLISPFYTFIIPKPIEDFDFYRILYLYSENLIMFAFN